jgi:hypothetical protein
VGQVITSRCDVRYSEKETNSCFAIVFVCFMLYGV